MSKRSLVWLLLVSLACPCVVRADGLRKMDDAASSRRRSEPSHDRDQDSDEDADEDQDEDQDESGSSSDGISLDEEESGALADAFAFVFLMPWGLPIHLMDEPCLRGYDRYPYAAGRGHLRSQHAHCARRKARRGMIVHAGVPVEPRAQSPAHDSAAADDFPVEESTRAVAAQLDVEAGYMRQEVVPATLALRLQMPRRLELSARSSLLTDLAEPAPERAIHSNALLSWRFAQSQRVDLRSGLGVRHYRLEKDRWGFDFLYGLDFFTRHHLVGRAELHLGSLQRAFALEARGTLGVMVNRVEIYAGGDVLALFGPGQKARLGGAVGGVRLWF